MKTVKAIVANVKIGNWEIEGLMLPDGTFGIAVPQIAALFSLANMHASRDIKSLMGKDFSFAKTTSELNSQPVNYVTLEQFSKISFELALSNKPAAPLAIEFCRNLYGLSLHQLFCDAFNIKFEGAERQEWLKQRLEGKATRLTFTDAIKLWLDNPENNASDNHRLHLYANCSDAINVAVFNRRAATLAKDWNVDKKVLRDSMTDKELSTIKMIEDQAMRIILNSEFTLNPLDAVKQALERLLFDKVLR